MEPLRQAAKKEKEEKEKRKALKLEKKQALEAQKREEEQRVKAELARKQQEEAEAKLREVAAKEKEQKKWEAEKKELNNLRALVLGSQPLNALQKLQFTELERKEKEKKTEQAEKMAKQKQQRKAEQAENEKNDNLHLDLATNLKNREKGLWGDKIEEDNDEDDYKANDIDNNPQLPSYEKDTYNNVPFTQLSPAKQEKIIQEYKKGELERFYYEKAQAETTNKKNTWEKVPPVVKKAITDKYTEDKQKKIIGYYYINYYKHNKRSFDQLSLEQRKQVERAFNNFIDKEEVKESYEWECDKNIRKIHSEDPQFKYNVAFFELNNGLQIRKKEEYIQKKEIKKRKNKKMR